MVPWYTSNKTRPLLGEQGGVMTGIGDGYHTRTSPMWSGGTFGTESGYPDVEAAADVSSGHSRCRVEGFTSRIQSLLEDELP